MGLACRLSALGLLLRALLVCTQSQDQEPVFAIVGEDFTFSPKVTGTIREITWMKRKDKVAEWEHGLVSPIYYSSLAERGKLETSSGNFTIKKLNVGDAAEYEAQVLPDGDVQLQYTKFILEVLDPPPPSVLNCSVTNGQIRISCAIQFSKDVRYSWYRGGRKIAANSLLVLKVEENADPSEEVLCIGEVSKTKINNSICLSACFPKSDESISRGRDGLIAFFVILPLLLLFVSILFILWRRGSLSRILRQIPTKHSAIYKPEEHHLTDDRFPEESGQTEDPEYENSRDFEVAAHQSGEGKKSEETKSMNQPDPPSSEENPDSENISDRNQEPGEGKKSEETKSMNQPDPPSSEENPDEDKSSKETKSRNQPDPPSNEEKTGEAAKLMQVKEDVRVSLQDSKESQAERGEAAKSEEIQQGVRTSFQDSNESQTERDEQKSSKDTESMNQPDPLSSEENPDYENISDRNQEPGREELKTKSMNLPDPPSNEEKTDLKLQSEAH